MKYRFVVLVIFSAIGLLSPPASAQDVPAPASPSASRPGKPGPPPKPEHDGQLEPGEDPENRLLTPFLKHLAGDQKEFWTAPTRLKRERPQMDTARRRRHRSFHRQR